MKDMEEDYRRRLMRALAYIQERLEGDLDPEAAAAAACFSLSHFHRLFKAATGETLMEHVRRLRLEAAAARLAYGRTSVTDLAFASGYETLESFSRAFKAAFGCAPSRYRQTRKEGPPPGLPSPTPQPYGAIPMDVQIRKFPPLQVAFVRHTGPYAQCRAAWEKLCAWAGPLGLFGPDALCIGRSYDDPTITPPDKIRYDACLSLNREVTPGQGVELAEIPGGDYAVALHKGPYEGLEAAYTELMGRRLPALRREMRLEPSLEIYMNDPATTRPEDLLTEIRIPLA